jgi:hypothetical protein
MKLSKLATISTLTLILATISNPVLAAPGGNGGGNGGGNNGGGGKEDEGPAGIVLVVESTDPLILSSIPGPNEIQSHNVSSQGQAVFYDVFMDMSQFEGNLDSGPICDHDIRDGILVIEPKSKSGPVAQLLFWFNSELESLDGVTHLFRMEGIFVDLQNWPPAPGTSTLVEFDSWMFSAENRKAQRQDCAGESPDSFGTKWIFTVTQAPAAP